MSVMVEYVKKDSLIHKLNPLTKIIWTFVVLIISFMLSEPALLLAILFLNLIFAALGRVINQVIPILKGLMVFAGILILFQIFFVDEGNTLLLLVPYQNWSRITDTGLELSFVMALRMLATVSAIPILMLTTPMTEIIFVLTENLRIPFKYAFMFITALRFIPAFLDELDLILQAQMSRGYHSDTRNPFKRFVIILPLAIPLLVSSVKKTEKTAISMEVRGFGSGPRSHFKELKMRKLDYYIVSLFSLIIVITLALKLLTSV